MKKDLHMKIDLKVHVFDMWIYIHTHIFQEEVSSIFIILANSKYFKHYNENWETKEDREKETARLQ